jgi:cation diffusion facilitator family transporter
MKFIKTILCQAGPHSSEITFWVAIFTVLLKLVLIFYTRKVGEETNNAAVMALAYDHRNDLFAAIAVALGIFLSRLGYVWFDPLAGALISFVILRTGIQIVKQSASDLMDAVPGDEFRLQIESLLDTISEIEQVDEIRAHRFGPYIVVNITICVNGDLSVTEGDRIATQVEDLIMGNIDFVKSVHVHYHPTSLHNKF